MTLLKVGDADGTAKAVFRASGNVIDFPGFLRAYVEGLRRPRRRAGGQGDDPAAGRARATPSGEGARVRARARHVAPRATDRGDARQGARGVEGIGRPSTYASIIDTILRRDYTFKKGSALVPTFTAFAVVSLMERAHGST